jgi:diguanylate cyclase (GGDEF)-like protein
VISTEPILVVLAVAIVAMTVMAALIVAALRGRGPLYGRFLEIGHRPGVGGTAPRGGSGAGQDDLTVDVKGGKSSARTGESRVSPNVRLLARERRPEGRADAAARHNSRTNEGLDEVLRGSYAVETFNTAVRVLAWSFILSVWLIVSISQLWQTVEPQIFATLILGGIVVLVVHELMPPARLSTLRLILEASAAIAFLTGLVLLTGRSASPFFFIYVLLIGGTALVASPLVTLLLTFEVAVAYAVAAFSGPLDDASLRSTLTQVGINLTVLVLLAYAGMVISRVQRRTRDAAIRLSTVDSLTDLYNRAFLFNSVDHEIQRSRRYRRGFCLLMMDLDGLKSINDRFGHYEGDLVLRGVSQVICSCLRGIDVAARYGGDEFVAMLPETDPSGAYVVAEKIRQGVSEMIVEAGGQQIGTSMSIGVVTFPEDGQTADELMIAADEAMYSSKRLGKNRVVGYAAPGEATQPLPQQFRQVATPGFRPYNREEADVLGSERAEK